MPKLRAVEPAKIVKRPKMFWFGETGSWKTRVGIGFPRPYVIDTEQGATNDQYAKTIAAGQGKHWSTTDLDEIIEEVVTLATVPHEFKTLLIDPITTPYNEACDRAARELAAKSKDPSSDGTEFGRHKGIADRKMKRLFNLLTRLDMNVVLTSHLKTKWEKVGDGFKEAGTTFDCYAKLEYLFDLVLEIQKRGKERWGLVRKSRLESFPEGDQFLFSYQEIAQRYGLESMEKATEPIELASPQQVARLEHLTKVLKIDDEQIEKWLDRVNATCFVELPAAAANQLAVWLESKVSPVGEEV